MLKAFSVKFFVVIFEMDASLRKQIIFCKCSRSDICRLRLDNVYFENYNVCCFTYS